MAAQPAARGRIITNGAGNFSGWVQRFYQYTGFRTQLAPTNGAMGYGVPAAVAAKLAHPDRTVVCFAGDGDFLMNGQELATAVQYGAAVIFVVVNNGMYGTIRMHQERDYPARVYGTALRNPDFAQLAQSLRSARRGGGEDGGFRAGIRAGAGLRRPGAAGAAHRSRCHHHAHQPDGDSREGVTQPRARSSGIKSRPPDRRAAAPRQPRSPPSTR